MPRPRLSSIFSFQITGASFQLSEEDLQYLDEISFNISSASKVNLMSNHTSAELSNNNFSGNFSTTTQAVMVEVLRSTAIAGISTTPSDMAMCDFSAIKVANSSTKKTNIASLGVELKTNSIKCPGALLTFKIKS